MKFVRTRKFVTKFERQNPGLSVNVFGWKVRLYPLHLSKQEGHAIGLLLIADEKDPQDTLCLDQGLGSHAI